MGVVPELFRTWPGVLRSSHPAFSLAAHGPDAAFLLAEHDLSEDCGDRSPVGKLYACDGHVLLLGVGHGNNTSLHLAETRAAYAGKRYVPAGSAMLVDGQRQWVTYQSLDLRDDDFVAVGAAFEAAHGVPVQNINGAEVRFFRQRPLVDFAVRWMEENRGRN
jgi:aminoglycoside 3-N-acetyltransferase